MSMETQIGDKITRVDGLNMAVDGPEQRIAVVYTDHENIQDATTEYQTKSRGSFSKCVEVPRFEWNLVIPDEAE